MTKNILFILLFCSSNSLFGQIKWLSLEEAYKQNQSQPKKIMVDVYTDWCHWCKVMDRKTFANKLIVSYINKNYYAVKLDAESKKTIKISNTIFKFDPNTGLNQAASTLLNNQMSFPSVVFMDEKFKVISPVPGFHNAKEFLLISTYFNENQYQKKTFEDFKKSVK